MTGCEKNFCPVWFIKSAGACSFACADFYWNVCLKVHCVYLISTFSKRGGLENNGAAVWREIGFACFFKSHRGERDLANIV